MILREGQLWSLIIRLTKHLAPYESILLQNTPLEGNSQLKNSSKFSRLMRMNGKNLLHMLPSIIMSRERETALKSMIIVFLTELNLSMLFTLQKNYIL